MCSVFRLTVYIFLNLGSSVGIATGYRLDRLWIKFSTPVQTSSSFHPTSCVMGTGSFSGVESGWGMTLTPHPLLVPRSKNRVGYTSTLPKGLCGL
jgi:hypothetical protein